MTELTALEELARRGFADGFRVIDGNLRVLTTGKLLRPGDLVIREVYRFEGISDPDDMAIVYAIESTTGVRGTLIDDATIATGDERSFPVELTHVSS